MTTIEFFDYLADDDRTRGLGADLCAVLELRQRAQAGGRDTTTTAERVPIAAA